MSARTLKYYSYVRELSGTYQYIYLRDTYHVYGAYGEGIVVLPTLLQGDLPVGVVLPTLLQGNLPVGVVLQTIYNMVTTTRQTGRSAMLHCCTFLQLEPDDPINLVILQDRKLNASKFMAHSDATIQRY